MKKTLTLGLLFFCTCFFSFGQQLGFSLGWGTSQSVYADLFLGNETHRFHLGASYQIPGTKGPLIKEQLPNYGRTIDGTGRYYLAGEIGYGHVFRGRLTIGGELSIGSEAHFINYIDHRFTEGGYHMIDRKEWTAGIGGSVGYIVLESLEIYGGYNTLRKFTIGLRVLL